MSSSGAAVLNPAPAQPLSDELAVDTTGAGDAFNAALAVGLADGLDLGPAVEWATAAGALSTRRVGARDGLPTGDEVATLLRTGMVA